MDARLKAMQHCSYTVPTENNSLISNHEHVLQNKIHSQKWHYTNITQNYYASHL